MKQASNQQNAVIKPSSPAEDGSARYCWRIHDGSHWLAGASEGDVPALVGAMKKVADITLLAPGAEAVVQKVGFNPAQKRHLANVIPFELEEELTEEPDDFHFALGEIEGAEVTVAYLKQDWMNEHLPVLEDAGLEINRCLLEPLALPCQEHRWGFKIDAEGIDVRYGPQQGFRSHLSLAQLTLEALLKTTTERPQQLEVFLCEDMNWQTLLPEALRNVPAKVHKNDGWQHIDPRQFELGIDLRQGSFTRKLPILRWAREWRTVAIVAGVVLAVFIGTNVAQIYSYNSQQAEVRDQMVATARQVIPNGNIVDPERSLRSLLNRSGNAEAGANGSAVAMLSKVAPPLVASDKIILRSLNYDGARDEMAITLQTDSYDTILKLRDEIQKTGLVVELGASSQVGNGQQQARMTITRNNT